MNGGEAALVLLVLVPVMGALVCILLRRDALIRAMVIATTVVLSISAIALLLYMSFNGLSSFTIRADELFPGGSLELALGYLLPVVLLYLGYRARSYLAVGLAIFNLIVLTAINSWMSWGQADPVIYVDYLSLVLVLITCLVGSVICIYALRYMEHDANRPRFFAVMLLFLGAMNGAVISNDMLWLLMFWEVTTLCSFLLIGHTGTDEAKRAALRALVITMGGGSALILGVALAFHYYGSIAITDIPLVGIEGLAILPLSLFAIAAFTKSAQVPFQSWLLGAMVAPTPVSALLHSSTMVNLGVYLLLRFSPYLQGSTALDWTVAAVGAVSFLVATVLAMTQSNSKRVLAYSTIGNLGLITMCAGLDTPLAIAAALILLLYHAISKALMFLSVGAVKERLGSEDIEDMAGLRITMPFVSLALFVGIITIVLPPFGMFASKWLISEAATSFPIFTFLLAAGFAATVVFYFKWLGNILSAGPGETTPSVRADPLSLNYKYTLGSLMLGAVVLSVLIGPVIRYLLQPYISLYYGAPIATNDFSLLSSLGVYPVVLFLVLAGIIFLGLGLLIRPGKEEVSTPYTGGENFSFQFGGSYYLTETRVGWVTRSVNVMGVLLLVLAIVIPLVLGAV